MSRKKKAVFLSAVFIVIPVVAGKAILHSGKFTSELVSDEVSHATDAAYRDGLFQGKLAADRGHKPIPSVGRWSSGEDRSSFVAGFTQGYQRQLAARR
jgi:hypothetical protein